MKRLPRAILIAALCRRVRFGAAKSLLMFTALIITPPAFAVPFCPATPDLVTIKTQQVINTYYPGNASVASGATSIPVVANRQILETKYHD